VRQLSKAVTSLRDGANDVDAVALEVPKLAEGIAETAMRASMLGALDAHTEDEESITITPAKFKRPTVGLPFTVRPFQEAIDDFAARGVVSRDVFDKMASEAKARAFTVAGTASQSIRDAIKEELQKSMADGADLRDFRKRLKGRMEVRGWLKPGPGGKPGSAGGSAATVPTQTGTPWHVETIFRNGTMASYARGRQKQMLQPNVLKRLPFWEIVTIRDSRRRTTHGKAHGKVLSVYDPFWQTVGTPPWGHNCRCRVITRSRKRAEAKGITDGSSIVGLPDPGFTGQTISPPGIPEPAPIEPTPEEVPAVIEPNAPTVPSGPPKGPSVVQSEDRYLDESQRSAIERLDTVDKDPKANVEVESLGVAKATAKEAKLVRAKLKERAYIKEKIDRLGRASEGFVPSMPDGSNVFETVQMDQLVFPKSTVDAREVAELIRTNSAWGDNDPIGRAVRIGDKVHVIDADLAMRDALVDHLGGKGSVRLRVVRAPVNRLPKPFKNEKAANRALAKAFSKDLNIPANGAEARLAVQDLLATDGIASQDNLLMREGAEKYRTTEIKAFGSHGWRGDVNLRVSVADDAASGFRKLAKGKEPSPSEAQAIATIIHEEIHGAGKGVATSYQGMGVGMEEAATEILARRTSRRIMKTKTDRFLLPNNVIKTRAEALADRELRGAASGSGALGEYRAYDSYISRFLKPPRAAGYSDQQIESALLKLRSSEAGPLVWRNEVQQMDHFSEELSKVEPVGGVLPQGNAAHREAFLKRGLRDAGLDEEYL